MRLLCGDDFSSHSLTLAGLDSIYYQAFPCLRIVQPGEFSIGPHADVALWHLSEGLWPWPMTKTVADFHWFHEATGNHELIWLQASCDVRKTIAC